MGTAAWLVVFFECGCSWRVNICKFSLSSNTPTVFSWEEHVFFGGGNILSLFFVSIVQFVFFLRVFFCLFFPRASERRVLQKEGGVNRSTYKRSSHISHLLTSSHISHLLTSSHISHLLTSHIFSQPLTSDIFSHLLTSSHI